MRTTLLALALPALAAAAAADETKAPAAKVRLSGEINKVSTSATDDKITNTATFTTPAGVKIELRSSDSFSDAHLKAIKAKVALIKEQLDATKKLLADEKVKGKARDAALDRLKAEYKARERSLVVAEGALSVADKKLRLSGTARLADPKKADKDLPAGGAIVEGEAQAGKFTYGKDKEATLAIKNGDAPIYVTGKAVGDEGRKGKLRVYGHLKQGDKGALVLEATKIEEAK
jgi:hypothetical protein